MAQPAGSSTQSIRLGFWAPVYGNWIFSKQRDTHNASFEYTRRLTALAEDIGFATMLLAEHTFNPFDPESDQLETWTSTAGLATITKYIELMPAVRPTFKHPVLTAKMAGNIDHMSGGRMAINLVSGWWQKESEAMGIASLEHDDRYQRSEEYLSILKGLWTQPHFSFSGQYYQVNDITLAPFPIRKPHPRIYLGGESDIAQRLAAKLADEYLINGRPVEKAQELIDHVRPYAVEYDRHLQFGISAFVICRQTKEEAWAEHARLHALRAEEMIPGVDRKVQMIRTYAYRPGAVGSNGGTDAGLVGTPQEIADRICAFRDVGVTTFLLQFHPMLEEMRRFGEEVVPRLEQAGVWLHPQNSIKQEAQHESVSIS